MDGKTEAPFLVSMEKMISKAGEMFFIMWHRYLEGSVQSTGQANWNFDHMGMCRLQTYRISIVSQVVFLIL